MLIPRVLTFLVNAAWQVSAIALLTALVSRLLPRLSARARYRLYVTALVASGAVPLLTMPQVSAATTRLPMPASSAALPNLVVAHSTGALVVWLAVLAMSARLLRLLSAMARSRGVGLQLVEGDRWEMARRAALALGVSNFRLFSSPSAPGPFTYGRSIVVPADLLGSEAAELFTAAIGHELAHVRRHDFATNLLLELGMVPLAFHPGAWFLKRRIDDARELACDEQVVEAGLQDRQSYARSLLHLAEAALGSPRLSYAMGAVAPPLLEERIRILVGQTAPKQGRLATLWLGMVAAAALLSTGFRVPTTVINDWLAQGLSACRSGDLSRASETVGHLDEAERADLLMACAAVHVEWCDDRGFHPEEIP